MANIYLFSGPCGCGKTTITAAFAKQHDGAVYIIHGDDFQAGFLTPEGADGPSWPEILRFSWECILATAHSALSLNVDVIIDYVVEDELPQVQALARHHGATLHYIVLTADEATLRARLQQRGDGWLTERTIFLKNKLESMPENQGYLLDITALSIEATIDLLQADSYIL